MTVPEGRVLRRFRAVRGRRDEGAAAVEFAIVSLLLFTIVFGIIEFSLLLRDHVAATSAVRTGARIASASPGAGPCNPATDGSTVCPPSRPPLLAQAAADAIQRQGTALPKDAIDELWVYKANSTGLPGSATSWSSASCTTNCVKYRWADASNRFIYVSGTWNTSQVNACIGSADAVGVYLKATHRFITGLFGSSVTVSDNAVMQFEPLPTDQCSPGSHP
jgi:hypothetical protein